MILGSILVSHIMSVSRRLIVSTQSDRADSIITFVLKLKCSR